MIKNQKSNGPYELTEAQIQMLQLSDKDIAEGKVLSQEQLDKYDLDWLEELDGRYNDHVNGIGRSYGRDEIDAIIDKALAERKN